MNVFANVLIAVEGISSGVGIGDIVSGGPWLVVAWVVYHLLTKRLPAQDETIKALTKTISRLERSLIHHGSIDDSEGSDANEDPDTRGEENG